MEAAVDGLDGSGTTTTASPTEMLAMLRRMWPLNTVVDAVSAYVATAPDGRRTVTDDADTATTVLRATAVAAVVDVTNDATLAVAAFAVVEAVAEFVDGDDVSAAAATPPPTATKAVAVQMPARFSRVTVERYTVTPLSWLHETSRTQRGDSP